MSITVGVNSYVTLEEAELIIADMFNADEWTALTDQQKEKALKTAVFQGLDLLSLRGTKLDSSTQVLEFPRSYETTVSNSVKMAQCYEAVEIARANYSAEKAQQEGISSKSIAGASVSYNTTGKTHKNKTGLYSKSAYELLSKYIQRVGNYD
jgi:hypothetical protein